jgi:fluoride ion exporter CrcB/FEX
MELKNIVWVGLGGMLGALARYFLGLAIKSDSFPYATVWLILLGH